MSPPRQTAKGRCVCTITSPTIPQKKRNQPLSHCYIHFHYYKSITDPLQESISSIPQYQATPKPDSRAWLSLARSTRVCLHCFLSFFPLHVFIFEGYGIIPLTDDSSSDGSRRALRSPDRWSGIYLCCAVELP